MANKFLTKYFPPTKSTKFRGDITTFTQFDTESIYNAWQRYKGLIRKISNHGLPEWLEIQLFYNELQINTKMMVDAAARGALMSKNRDDAYELLEEMVSNNYQWQTKRATPKKIPGMHEPNDITTIHVQLASLTNQLGAINHQQHPSPQEKKLNLEIIIEQLATTMHAFMADIEIKIEN